MKNVAKSENEELVHGDDIWYNATYQVAATYTYRGDWSDADKTSKELLNAVQETKKALEKCESSMFHKFTKLFRWQVRDYFESAEKLKKRLDEIEPIIIIQRAIHLVGLGGKNISCAKALVDDLEKKLEDDGTELSYRSKYSLACYYSLLGESETKSEKTKTATYDNSLEYLKEALNQEGSIIHWAKIDPDLKGVYHGKRTEFAKLEEKYEFKASKQGTLMENEV